MTVARLRAEMPATEFLAWYALYQREEQERRLEEAKQRAQANLRAKIGG